MTDCELGQRIANSDETAFQVFFDRHYGWVFRRALHLLKSHHDAEEAASDVFVKIWQHRDKFDPQKKDATFMAWVNVVCQRKLIDALRIKNRDKARNRHGDLQSIEDHALLEHVVDTAPDASRHVVANETIERIESALLKVSNSNHRIAWILRYFEGYKPAEISRILKAPTRTCRVWEHRCNYKLRELLTEDTLYVGL